MPSQQTGERMGSRPQAAKGGGAPRASLEAGRSPVYFSTVALVGQDGGSPKSDLPDGASGIFLREGLDILLVICPSCQFAAHIDCCKRTRSSAWRGRQSRSAALTARRSPLSPDSGPNSATQRNDAMCQIRTHAAQHHSVRSSTRSAERGGDGEVGRWRCR
jgi:hypothetical protein